MTNEECKTPSMCAPFGGCRSPEGAKQSELERRVERLERIVEHLCPDKSDDI
jgi:hypothetical protein